MNFSFDTVKRLNKVVVYFPGYNAVLVENQVRDYVVDVQLENGAWERVAEKHNAERSHWDAFNDTLCFAPIECKNLRITCVNTQGQSSIGFYEIEAYNDESLTSNDYTIMDSKDYTADAIPLPEVVDLMNNATLSANSAYHNGWYDTNRPLSNLTDGDTYVGVGYNTGKTATIPMESNGTGYVNAHFGTATTLNKVGYKDVPEEQAGIIIYFDWQIGNMTTEDVAIPYTYNSYSSVTSTNWVSTPYGSYPQMSTTTIATPHTGYISYNNDYSPIAVHVIAVDKHTRKQIWKTKELL